MTVHVWRLKTTLKARNKVWKRYVECGPSNILHLMLQFFWYSIWNSSVAMHCTNVTRDFLNFWIDVTISNMCTELFYTSALLCKWIFSFLKEQAEWKRNINLYRNEYEIGAPYIKRNKERHEPSPKWPFSSLEGLWIPLQFQRGIIWCLPRPSTVHWWSTVSFPS